MASKRERSEKRVSLLREREQSVLGFEERKALVSTQQTLHSVGDSENLLSNFIIQKVKLLFKLDIFRRCHFSATINKHKINHIVTVFV